MTVSLLWNRSIWLWSGLRTWHYEPIKASDLKWASRFPFLSFCNVFVLFFIFYHFIFLIPPLQSVFSPFFPLPVDLQPEKPGMCLPSPWEKTSWDSVDIESEWQCTCVSLNNLMAVSCCALLSHKDSCGQFVWLTDLTRLTTHRLCS